MKLSIVGILFVFVLVGIMTFVTWSDYKIAEDIPGVDYTISNNCNGHRGYWTPGKICYDGTFEVKQHENCHELAFRNKLTLQQNSAICDHK